ncbi:PepSY-associated TM helix domain-containing protein [Adhaeribacter aquaticus]|uniref:PepSY-associated TM helix domain-containing protein n=1 Tax=Adhaeribacter aquaticus TaxID=299567 RepID=UPI00041ACFB6|nr:PepSY-associated TM helix domain-containing protein [Adhaeribacter aquaticus]
MKNFFRSIHLYLSLAAGLVIALVCLTGAALVFEKEWMQTIYPERYKVEAGSGRVPLDQLLSTLQQSKPDAKVAGLRVYGDLTRTVEINFTEEKAENSPKEEVGQAKGQGGENKKGDKGGNGGKGPEKKPQMNQAYFNPYTGALITTSKQRNAFFTNVFGLHRWLLNQDGPGKLIVGVSTVFFLFIILTGIVLWWPKTKKVLQQRLTLRWDAGWKRINHDLHIVIGFYTAIFLFVFAFTGLAWSFEWFNDSIYKLTNSDKQQPEPPLSLVQEGASTIGFEKAFQVVQNRMPNAEFYTLNKPKEAADAFSITVMPGNARHERDTNQLFVDQYSGEVLKEILFKDKNLGQRVRATFYPVHVGSIGGLPGRVIAFICCIAGFTFPITGVILWLNRLNKNRKKKEKKVLKQRV